MAPVEAVFTHPLWARPASFRLLSILPRWVGLGGSHILTLLASTSEGKAEIVRGKRGETRDQSDTKISERP